jgi:hypothetical protein
MKFCPGVVPQCPSSMCFTSASIVAAFSSGIVEEINLPDRQIVRRPPVGIQGVELVWSKRLGGHG